MSSVFGNKIKISIFGQSHSKAIGVVIDGLPANEALDLDQINAFMRRRAPGQNSYSTRRKEEDLPVILSGLVDGKTCGAPLCAIIENKDTRSGDYKELKDIPRPSHADYPAFIKYMGANDVAGGGHFSGRLTAPLCFAGAVAVQLLKRRGITIGAHIASIASIKDTPFDPVGVTAQALESVSGKPFPVVDDSAGERMRAVIDEAFGNLDSVGGTIECCAHGVACGLGEPMFNGLENAISAAVFAIPAVKGIAFGNGFEASELFGSENNDAFYVEKGSVKTKTNRHGGILGGISTGMPILFKIAIKPTASIARAQDSVSLTRLTNEKLIIKGRHDPCIVPRAVPCVEAALALVLADFIL